MLASLASVECETLAKLKIHWSQTSCLVRVANTDNQNRNHAPVIDPMPADKIATTL